MSFLHVIEHFGGQVRVAAGTVALLGSGAYGLAQSSDLLVGHPQNIDGFFEWALMGDGGTLCVASADTAMGLDLLRFDVTGQLLWERHYAYPGGSMPALVFDVRELSNGDILLFSNFSESIPLDSIWTIWDNERYLARFNAIGDVLWSRAFDFGAEPLSDDKGVQHIVEVGEGDLLLQVAHADGINMAKLSASGGLLWSKRYASMADSTMGSMGVSLRGLSDNTAMVTGSVFVGPPFLMKMDVAGDVMWMKTYTEFTEQASFRSIAQGADGRVLACAGSMGATYLAEIDPSGTILWAKTYSGFSPGGMLDIVPLAEGGFVLSNFVHDQIMHVDDVGQPLGAWVEQDSLDVVSIQVLGTAQGVVAFGGRRQVADPGFVKGQLQTFTLGDVPSCFFIPITVTALPVPGLTNATGSSAFAEVPGLPITTFDVPIAEVSEQWEVSSFCSSLYVMEEQRVAGELQVSPVPQHRGGDVVVTGLATGSTCTLCSTSGQMVFSGPASGASMVLSTAGLNGGVYVFRCEDPEYGPRMVRLVLY